VCAAIIVFDSPYNKTQETWDELVTYNKMGQILKQMSASQQANEYIILIWHDPTETGNVHQVLRDNGFKELANLYWVKENHSTPTSHGYTSVVEQATVGYHPCRVKCCNNMDENPRKRMNVVTMPAVTKYHRDEQGEVVNPCQKPPQLFKEFCERHSLPNNWVLVVGPGAGGEVMGAILAGMNVVAVEMNLRQFNCLQKILLDYNTSCEDQEKSGSQDVDDMGRDLQTSFQSQESPRVPAKPSAPQSSDAPVKCASCGVPMKAEEKTYKCTHDDCEDYNVFHFDCVHLDKYQQWVCDEHYDKPEAEETEEENTVETQEEV
jgi:hypothetical protein